MDGVIKCATEPYIKMVLYCLRSQFLRAVRLDMLGFI